MQIYQYLHEIGLNEVLVIDENMGLCLYMYRDFPGLTNLA